MRKSRLVVLILVALFAGTAAAYAAVHKHAATKIGNAAAGAQALAAAPVLLGDTKTESFTDSNGTSPQAWQYTAATTGTASDVEVYDAKGAAKITVGLYADASGKPGKVLAAGSVTKTTAGAWNDVKVGTAQITAGTKYWLAIQGNISFRDAGSSAKGCSTVGSNGSIGNVGSSWTNAWTATSYCPASFYVNGTTVAPPPVTTTSTTTTTPPVTTTTTSTTSTTTTTPPVTTTTTSSTTTQPPPPPPTGCTTSVTTATFAAAVTAAKAGDVLCLATGNYGSFAGTNKAITIQAAAGAAPSMTFDLASGDTGFTLTGMSGMSGSIDTGASNITISDSTFTNAVGIDGLSNANVTFDHDTFNNENEAASCSDEPARIHLEYGGVANSGVTVEDSQFIDPTGGLSNARDGIQTGVGMTIKNDVFENILDNGGCNHQDAIQSVGATNVVATGNLLINDDDGFASFDGSGNDTITDNACLDIGRGACITLYSDSNSVVNHNTAIGMRSVELDRKPADPAGSGTIVENNIGDITVEDGSTVAAQTHNLYSGATSPDINGTPVFAGGNAPSAWAGFELAASSAGKGAATDSQDVGIRATAGGPPTS